MNAKRLFDDDDLLFADPSNDRASHVEIRVDAASPSSQPETQREIATADDYFRRVPRVVLGGADVNLLPLDHREGFLLSMVDGETTIETILDVCAMPEGEALEILESLAERGVIRIPG